MPPITRHPASFRDPSGFVFTFENKIYRQVNKYYEDNFLMLKKSGLYKQLTDLNLLLSHTETNQNHSGDSEWLTTLFPEQIPFIAYPYEWCFEQFKDAALLTLRIVKKSIEKGMILKDATPFNIQFVNNKPIFIDTLSFEKYDETKPWIAYRQFCESFLFPLWISHYHKLNFQKILTIYSEGIPTSLAAKLLPPRSRFNLGVLLHVRLQNKMTKKELYSNSEISFSKKKLLNLITHLEQIISPLSNKDKTTWSGYYDESISSREYLIEKEEVIKKLLKRVEGQFLLDLGANNGHFSLLAAKQGFSVIAVDNDEQCINDLYLRLKKDEIKTILPLCIDLSNPSPSIGFGNTERNSWQKRITPDVILALALIHHLVIGKNIPLMLVAEYLSKITHQLIIEFVSIEDSKTQQLLKNRKNLYDDYKIEKFESAFQKFFSLEEKIVLLTNQRTLYLLKKISSQN